MNELVKQLSEGSHQVELTLRPERTVDALKACLARRYVHIKFTETRGGTELGVRIDDATAERAIIELERPAGTIHIAGELILDYVPVRCIAEIDFSSCQGTGHLEVRSSGDAG